MNWAKILGAVLAIAFGVFLVIFGEQDDSPGAQLLGVVVAVGGLYVIYKAWKNSVRDS